MRATTAPRFGLAPDERAPGGYAPGDRALGPETEPVLHVYPADPGLERDVRDGIRRLASNPIGLKDAVESELRFLYRHLVIHEQEPLAQLGPDASTTWYVLREGRFHAPYARADRLYRALWDARDECRRSSAALDRARGVMSSATIAIGDRAADRPSEGERAHG